MPPPELQKRTHTQTISQDADAKNLAKRLKVQEARRIQTESSDKALNDRKELDVAAFVKAREVEISSLEANMSTSKSALATRAFQLVPRQLRRRTASHNVKRVPKRLRARATREMKEHNTSTVTARRRALIAKQRLRAPITHSLKDQAAKKALAMGVNQPGASCEGPDSPAICAPILVRKFKKRQLNKSWLPTHIYHAKRACMTPPSKPLWRFAIPLTPTEKSYRSTHRASVLRGCIAWDTSYVASIQLTGTEQSLIKTMKGLSVPGSHLTGQTANKWIQGLRSWSGWAFEQDNEKRPIAPITILWSPRESSARFRKLIIRIHPSAFFQLWRELVKLAKVQQPSVTIQDLRFELGSIEISGPAATEALARVLHPANPNSRTLREWSTLAAITNIAVLRPKLTVGFEIADPRLKQPHQVPSASSAIGSDAHLLQILAAWPPESEQGQFSLLDFEKREKSCRCLLSQKSVNRRKAKVLPGEVPPDLLSDPLIPLLLYTMQRKEEDTPADSWVLLLPWRYVLPVWHCLMQLPLSSGGEPRFGGLREQRQLFFESATPWFPGDFPGTQAGWGWELTERERRKADWEKRPKAKRVQWDTVDLGTGKIGEIGRGWACDWEYLHGMASSENEPTKAASTDAEISKDPTRLPANIYFVPSSAWPKTPSYPSGMLVAISLSFISRGHASECARIYRLPVSDQNLRVAWLALEKSIRSKDDRAPAATDATYPSVPVATDLVGFVTSGNYNLGEGRATAIGSILISRIQEDFRTAIAKERLSGLCIVRDVGTSIGRLASWDLCP